MKKKSKKSCTLIELLFAFEIEKFNFLVVCLHFYFISLSYVKSEMAYFINFIINIVFVFYLNTNVFYFADLKQHKTTESLAINNNAVNNTKTELKHFFFSHCISSLRNFINKSLVKSFVCSFLKIFDVLLSSICSNQSNVFFVFTTFFFIQF